MWKDLPISAKLFQNLDETAVTRATTALENAFVTEAKGLSGFPGLRRFSKLPSGGRVYLHDWRDADDDLVAVTSQGRVYRVDLSGTPTDVTGIPVSGGRRPTFAKTDDELLIAAGGPIIAYAGSATTVLSADAPESTHVGYIDGYTLAIEARSQRFYHTAPGLSRSWDPLDVFTAEGKADDLNALLVTEFRELLLCGEDSIEQFERLPNGDRPFIRRYASGQGLFAPYTAVTVDAGTWGVNRRREFYRLSGQSSKPASDDIGLQLKDVGDWSDAWAAECLFGGQKFIVLQMPNAATPYGTTGLTFAYDYRAGRWLSLYGWDLDAAQPARWPGWSLHTINGRTFVGGDDGVIFELDDSASANDGTPRRVVWRSAHYDSTELTRSGAMRIDNIAARMKRGVGPRAGNPATVALRARKDGGGWTSWSRQPLGGPGDSEFNIDFGAFGACETVQLEIHAHDAAQFELVRLRADLTPLDR